MKILSFKVNYKLKLLLPITFSLLLIFVSCYSLWQANVNASESGIIEWNNTSKKNNNKSQTEEDYIKWFEFNVSYDVLDKTSRLDINSHVNNENVKLNWIEIISYLACKYGNDFSQFKQKDLDTLVEKIRNGQTMEDLTKDMKYYSYYLEGYNSVLHEFIGSYKSEIKEATNQDSVISKQYEEIYGIKAFHPIAKNYSYSHYDDFGASRSYGYKRLHYGNDLMGSIGTPIIAVESGVIEVVGWNQYGGWRIGIRSFDGKRYYYYAHLRKNHPYAEGIEEGKIVKAGDIIGYLGMTGYSSKENVNNINVPHLHFGIQLIFNEVQKEGSNQIWVDLYNLVEFLEKNRSEAYKSNLETKDYSRKYDIIDPIIPE